MIEIGQKVEFRPFWDVKGFAKNLHENDIVTGTVVYVNYPHKWFLVEYGEKKVRTSFKFWELGAEVKLLK